MSLDSMKYISHKMKLYWRENVIELCTLTLDEVVAAGMACMVRPLSRYLHSCASYLHACVCTTADLFRLLHGIIKSIVLLGNILKICLHPVHSGNSFLNGLISLVDMCSTSFKSNSAKKNRKKKPGC